MAKLAIKSVRHVFGLVLTMRVMVLMEPFSTIRAFELMFFTGTKTKTDKNGKNGETFHVRLY